VVAGAGHYTYATILRITISDLVDQVSKRKEMSVQVFYDEFGAKLTQFTANIKRLIELITASA